MLGLRRAKAISVRDLRKAYGELQAVDGVTFEVRQGEFSGILGPNGAGKTTTLEIIEGLRQPDSGQVSLLGFTLVLTVVAARLFRWDEI